MCKRPGDCAGAPGSGWCGRCYAVGAWAAQQRASRHVSFGPIMAPRHERPESARAAVRFDKARRTHQDTRWATLRCRTFEEHNVVQKAASERKASLAQKAAQASWQTARGTVPHQAAAADGAVVQSNMFTPLAGGTEQLDELEEQEVLSGCGPQSGPLRSPPAARCGPRHQSGAPEQDATGGANLAFLLDGWGEGLRVIDGSTRRTRRRMSGLRSRCRANRARSLQRCHLGRPQAFLGGSPLPPPLRLTTAQQTTSDNADVQESACAGLRPSPTPLPHAPCLPPILPLCKPSTSFPPSTPVPLQADPRTRSHQHGVAFWKQQPAPMVESHCKLCWKS